MQTLQRQTFGRSQPLKVPRVPLLSRACVVSRETQITHLRHDSYPVIQCWEPKAKVGKWKPITNAHAHIK